MLTKRKGDYLVPIGRKTALGRDSRRDTIVVLGEQDTMIGVDAKDARRHLRSDAEYLHT